MKRERINKLNQLSNQIAIAERNFGASSAKATHWELRLGQLRKQVLSIQLEGALPLGRSTKKNQKKQIVWESVKEILLDLSGRAGMTTNELHRSALEHHHRLNIITFRAYLREFCEKRLLYKQGDRWNLSDVVKEAATGPRR